MLSIEKTRKILKRPELKDEEVENIRDSLYNLANIAIDVYSMQLADGAFQSPYPDTDSRFQAIVEKLPEDSRYDLEERAAIREADGGLNRDTAERKAIVDITGMGVNEK